MPAVSTLVMAGGTLLAANQASKQRRSIERERAKERAILEKSQKKFEERIAEYEKSEFKPLDIEALKQENVFEDVDLSRDILPAADYAKEQFQQQQANIMQGLRGVAGASGAAGLAQVLSNQAAQQSRQTAMTIGQQLARGRQLALQEQSRLNAQDRQVLLANMEGANQFELDKMATLMGVEGQKIAGSRTAMANLMSSQVAMQGAQMGMIGDVLGAVGGMDLGKFEKTGTGWGYTPSGG